MLRAGAGDAQVQTVWQQNTGCLCELNATQTVGDLSLDLHNKQRVALSGLTHTSLLFGESRAGQK